MVASEKCLVAHALLNRVCGLVLEGWTITTEMWLDGWVRRLKLNQISMIKGYWHSVLAIPCMVLCAWGTYIAVV